MSDFPFSFHWCSPNIYFSSLSISNINTNKREVKNRKKKNPEKKSLKESIEISFLFEEQKNLN